MKIIDVSKAISIVESIGQDATELKKIKERAEIVQEWRNVHTKEEWEIYSIDCYNVVIKYGECNKKGFKDVSRIIADCINCELNKIEIIDGNSKTEKHEISHERFMEIFANYNEQDMLNKYLGELTIKAGNVIRLIGKKTGFKYDCLLIHSPSKFFTYQLIKINTCEFYGDYLSIDDVLKEDIIKVYEDIFIYGDSEV